MLRKINKYSYNLKECDHDVFYILQEFENDGIEKYKYIAICLNCGKVIYEDRWDIPLPCNYIKGEMTLKDGTEIFIPYEQVKNEFKILREKLEEEGKNPTMLELYEEIKKRY